MTFIRKTLYKYKQLLIFLFQKKLLLTDDPADIAIKDFIYSVSQKDSENYSDALKSSSDNSSTIMFGEMHPLFYMKISWKIIENLNDFLEVPIDKRILERIVHTSERIIYYENIKIPQELIVKSKIWRMEPRKNGIKLQIRFDYFSEHILAATEYAGGLLYNVKLKGKKKTVKRKRNKKNISNTYLWKEEIKIPKDLPYTYAKKSKIDAPVHSKPKFAKKLGFPGVILQGSCTLAKSYNLIHSKVLSTGNFKLKSVSAKFTGIIVPPDVITVRILKNEEKLVIFDVLSSSGKAVIKGGEIHF